MNSITKLVATVGAYFLFFHPVLAEGTEHKYDMPLPITQWCNDPEAVDRIVREMRRPTHDMLMEYGCHWVPKFMPIEGRIEEVVNEYFIFGKFFRLVKVRLIGNFENPIGYTLIRGPSQ